MALFILDYRPIGEHQPVMAIWHAVRLPGVLLEQRGYALAVTLFEGFPAGGRHVQIAQ